MIRSRQHSQVGAGHARDAAGSGAHVTAFIVPALLLALRCSVIALRVGLLGCGMKDSQALVVRILGEGA